MNLTKEQAIEQIHGRVLAIENDNLEAANKCAKIIWPLDSYNIRTEPFIYRIKKSKHWGWDYNNPYKQSIPATELLRILEGEWMPEVGKEYQLSDDKKEWFEYKLVAIIDHEYKFITENKLGTIGYKFCRPIQKKQITIAELFEKANLDINQYEVVK